MNSGCGRVPRRDSDVTKCLRWPATVPQLHAGGYDARDAPAGNRIGMLPLVLAFLLVACARTVERQPAPATPDDWEHAAQAAADSWLGEIDAARYRESWVAAAAAARSVFPEDGWTRSIAGVRNRLGQLQSRTLVELRRDPELPGAPPGDYVIVEYRTRFVNDPATTEQVIMLIENGVWRGFGYSVRAIPR